MPVPTLVLTIAPDGRTILVTMRNTNGMRIPIYSGRVFRREAGHRSDLKPSTIPK